MATTALTPLPRTPRHRPRHRPRQRPCASPALARLFAGLVRAAAAALLAGCSGNAPDPAQNLLLVSIDTLRADALGVYGSTRGATPQLDTWAARGVLFERAFSHSPKTAPAHHSLLTSLTPRVHGVGNLDTAGASHLPPEAVPLAQTLATRGFRTGAFTGGGNIKALLGFDRGFEIYDDGPGTLAAKLTKARRWLRDNGDGRWFLFFHTYHVHDPYLVPADLLARFADPGYGGRIVGTRAELMQRSAAGEDLAPKRSGHDNIGANFWLRVDEQDPADHQHLHDLYTAGVADADRQIGDFLGGLERSGQLDNTLVVVTSDHGEEFGEHGRLRHDRLWQEVLHVPLLVQLPGGRAAGTRIAAPVRHIDFVPSALALLDVADTTHLRQGRSWADWIGRTTPVTEDRIVFGEHRSRREVPLDTWSLRRGGWLLLHDSEGDHLRDLRRDPAEVVPVADGERAAELRTAALAELARLESYASQLTRGTGVEIDAATRAELKALGYF